MRRLLISFVVAVALLPGADDHEFFEKEIRPLLAENCFSCHSAKATSIFAGLRVDSRQTLLRGGDSGPAIVPGEPGSSLILKALRGEGKTPMPPTGRLSADRIAAVEAWIAAGASWPEEQAPDLPNPSEAFDLEKRRSSHWAWQAVTDSKPPAVADSDWAKTAVDRFVLAKLEEKGLTPAAPADRNTWLRRVSYLITGLPPSPREIEDFVANVSPDAYERAVDRLLASPHYGERWARHWMDLVRYTESHGSEGDPDTREAWRYRDYLIRALNADVPYDQLIREHIAGDLLTEPRINHEDQINESIIATAHYRMIEHGFQPVDPWEDRVKWTDNQVDVFSKAFQGLTVSCARCHDHKFDAITQKDFYALFGIFGNARPTQRAIDSPDRLWASRDELKAQKAKLKSALADLWAAESPGLAARLLSDERIIERLLEEAACHEDHPLFPFVELADKSGQEFAEAWRKLVAGWERERGRRERFNADNFDQIWNVSKEVGADDSRWVRLGTGLTGPSLPGEFSITPEGDRIVEGIYGAGVHTALLTRRHNGVLQSPRFVVDTDKISFRVQGGGFSFVRLIVENYAVPRGGIYLQRYSPKVDSPVWFTWDTTFWKGFSAYLEFSTQEDSTNFLLDSEHGKMNPRPTKRADGRSFFGASAVAFHDARLVPEEFDPAIAYLLAAKASPESLEDLAQIYAQQAGNAIAAWRDGSMSEEQSAYLDFFVRTGLLTTSISSKRLGPIAQAYRALEAEVPIYRRAPGVVEEAGPDQALLIRGSHKNRGEPVPQRFLTALGSKPYNAPGTTRLRLAEEVTSPQNPLTARVMTNRIWRHVFGQGIVSSVDNFGRLGAKPSHPQLLDHLANRFVEDGWSIKKMIRRLVLTRAYRMSSEASEQAATSDPGNALLQHMPIRRLEAEIIRDSLLAVSGRLDRTVEGPSVNVFYAFAKGSTKGDRPKGPLDGEGRRSVYQEIRRNAHNPFLEVFDQPKPASTRGNRDTTNVPAQSLTMLNSPLVISQAELWGEALAQDPAPTADKVRGMFLRTFGRPPTAAESDGALTYMGDSDEAGAWADLAHSLFNLKEFIYVR